MIKVLHISRFFHPHVGGTETFIASLAGATAVYGVESRALVADRHTGDGGPEPQIPVCRVPVIGPDYMPQAIGGLRPIAQAFAWADVIHIHDLRFLLETSILVRAAFGKPVVVSTHGCIFHTARFQTLKQHLWRTYYHFLLSRASAILADSSQDFDQCARGGITQNVRLLMNPVDVGRFLSIQRHPPGTGRLLYFGRLAPNKGLEYLAPLMEVGANSWTLRVVGSCDPTFLTKLQAVFSKVKHRVAWLGLLPEAGLLEEISCADAVVLPSKYEGYGLTLVEALASGVPVIASDIPTYREIIGDSGVRLTDFADPPEATRAVERAMERYDVAAARARALCFSWEHRAPEFVRIYQEGLCAERRR